MDVLTRAVKQSGDADYWAICLVSYVMGFTVPVAGVLLFVTWVAMLIIENVKVKRSW